MDAMSPDRADADETPEALAGRLRQLPPPPLPEGLEARLIAAIPPPRRRRGRSARAWIAAAVLLSAAAAALLAVRVPPPKTHPVPSLERPSDDAPTWWRCEQALRRGDVEPSVALNRTLPPFEWPAAGSEWTLRSEPLQ
jgi:hypothetical protein